MVVAITGVLALRRLSRQSHFQTRPPFVMAGVVTKRHHPSLNSKSVIGILMKAQNRIGFGAAALTIAALVWSSGLGMAADKGIMDPTGTWKLATINSETKAKSPERTLKLKLEGGRLTGTIDGRSEVNGKVKMFEWAIKDTKLKGNDISFTVTHAPTFGNGPDSTTTYEGKITGDAMKGTAETEWSGNTHKRDFEARRVKE
jgi:hypothetical protein